MKYTKNPVEIEACKYNGTTLHCLQITAWINGEIDCPDIKGFHIHTRDYKPMFIDTLEGEMQADPGDYIIKGVKGEFYPCKPDIFKMTYEPANPNKEE